MKFFDKLFESRTKVMLALILPAALLYFKSIRFEFTTLDEQWMIVKNTSLPQGWTAVEEAFTTAIAGTYYRPLLNLSFFVDYCIGRLSPGVYHFTNLLLHLGCVLLLYRFLYLNKVNQKTAFVYTLIFSVHPAMLHAIAWVPGRNDLLLCLFSLASLNGLLRFFDTPDKRGYLVVHFLWFVCALLTKESAVVLPLAFAMLYYMHRAKLSRQFLYFCGAWLGLCLAWFLARSSRVFITPGEVGLSLTALKNTVPAMLLYIGKALLPVQQSVLPTLRDAILWPGAVVLGVLVLFAVKPGVSDKKTAGLGLLLFFTLLMVPVWFSAAKSGAEHYEHRLYTPLAGLVLFFSQLRFNTRSKTFYLVAVIIICLFSVRTYSRMELYRNKDTFVNAAVKESPGFYLFQFQKGELLAQRRQYDSALVFYNAAIALRQDKGQMYSNRGAVLYTLGRYQESVADFTKAIALSPSFDYRFYLNRCVAYARLNQTEQAMKDLHALQNCCPTVIPADLSMTVTRNWGLLMKGLELRLAADPQNHRLHFKRATLLLETGRREEGLEELRKAMVLATDNGLYSAAYKKYTAAKP